MGPTRLVLGPVSIPTHDAFTLLGVLTAAVVLGLLASRRGRLDRSLVFIAAGGMLGGGIGARLATVIRYLADADHPTWTGVLLNSGKTVVGGLAGAYVGVLVAKRVIGYREHTGDLFAPAVVLGIAVGRIGCFLTEPPGTPTNLPWAVTYHGVPSHPSMLYEIAFLLVLFGVLLWLRPRVANYPGELFKVMLVAYGSFRFLVEFVRGNEVWFLGLTRPQWALIIATPLMVVHFVRLYRSRSRQPVGPLGANRIDSEVGHEPATA